MTVQTLSDYMAACNAHYYATRDPLGTDGDFITAPEISQIFGEAIGLWLANEWMRAGSPPRFTLLEMGGGRGTLMADALRAIAQVMPAMLDGMTLLMLETSPLLRAKQQQALQQYNPVFISSLTRCHPERSEGSGMTTAITPDSSALPQDDTTVCALPPQPTFVIANEFFDALPINQYRCIDGQWFMQGVETSAEQPPLPLAGEGWGEGGRFIEIPINPANVPPHIQQLVSAEWAEYNHDAVTITRVLAAHIAQYNGVLLAIDYGHTKTTPGDTLQAVRKHRYANPLSTPGDIDLTAHVDFAVLANAAAPLQTTLTTQADFLHALGGRERLAALCAGKDKATQIALLAGYHRLTAPDQMGELFKVMVVTNSN